MARMYFSTTTRSVFRRGARSCELILAMSGLLALSLSMTITFAQEADTAKTPSAASKEKAAEPENPFQVLNSVLANAGSVDKEGVLVLLSLVDAAHTPALFHWKNTLEEPAVWNVRAVGDELRLQSGEENLILGRFAPVLRSLELELSGGGSGNTLLRLDAVDGADKTTPSVEIVLKGNRATVYEIRGERRRPKLQLESKASVTGRRVLNVLKHKDVLELFFDGDAPSTEVVLPEAIHGSFVFSIGAEKGKRVLRTNTFKGAIDHNWWKRQRQRFEAVSLLDQFQRNGVERLYAGINHKLANDLVAASLKGYSKEQKHLRAAQRFSALYTMLPENPLARFEYALALRDARKVDHALEVLGRELDRENPGVRALQIELMLRARDSFVHDAKHLPDSPRYGILKGLMLARRGKFREAIALFDTRPKAVAQDLAVSCERLLSAKSLQRIGESGVLQVFADNPRWRKSSFREIRRTLHALEQATGKVLQHRVKIYLFDSASAYTQSVLIYAHERVSSLAGLFVGKSDRSSEIFLCGSNGDAALMESLRHELWHAFVHQCDAGSIWRQPWLNEGCATLIGASDLGTQQQAVGGSVLKVRPPRVAGDGIAALVGALRDKEGHAALRQMLTEPAEFYSVGNSDLTYDLAWAIAWYHITRAERGWKLEDQSDAGSSGESNEKAHNPLSHAVFLGTAEALQALLDEGKPASSAPAGAEED